MGQRLKTCIRHGESDQAKKESSQPVVAPIRNQLACESYTDPEFGWFVPTRVYWLLVKYLPIGCCVECSLIAGTKPLHFYYTRRDTFEINLAQKG